MKRTKIKSPGSDALRASMAELKKYVDAGMSLKDIQNHYRKHHPTRIRMANTVSVSTPGEHTAASIKQLRLKLQVSQAVFAESLGVSSVLVQGWEQGVRTPSPLARRLLDIVTRDPASWLAGVQVLATTNGRRAS